MIKTRFQTCDFYHYKKIEELAQDIQNDLLRISNTLNKII